MRGTGTFVAENHHYPPAAIPFMHTDEYDLLASTPLTAPSDAFRSEPQPPSFAPSPRYDCLHHLFEAAAREWPDAVAIEVPPGRKRSNRLLVSYAELERRALAIAGRLRRFVTGECVVAIMLPRDSDLLYAAQLAVLKTGAAYMCIDPAFPDPRVSSLLADSEAVALLTDASGQERVRGAMNVGAVLDTRALVACVAIDDVTPARWLG